MENIVLILQENIIMILSVVGTVIATARPILKKINIKILDTKDVSKEIETNVSLITNQMNNILKVVDDILTASLDNEYLNDDKRAKLESIKNNLLVAQVEVKPIIEEISNTVVEQVAKW